VLEATLERMGGVRVPIQWEACPAQRLCGRPAQLLDDVGTVLVLAAQQRRCWIPPRWRQVSPSMGLSKDAISSGPLGTTFNPQVQRGTSRAIRTCERPEDVGASNS